MSDTLDVMCCHRSTAPLHQKELHNSISDYPQTDKFYAPPAGQRTLITTVLCRLLASSSFAIAGTLNSLIARLKGLLHETETELDLEDYDTYNDLNDERGDSSDETANGPEDAQHRRGGILQELERRVQFAALANSIAIFSVLSEGGTKVDDETNHQPHSGYSCICHRSLSRRGIKAAGHAGGRPSGSAHPSPCVKC